MKLLQLNIFSTYPPRLKLCFKCLDQLSAINPENRNKIKIVVFTSSDLSNEWDIKLSEIQQHGIECENNSLKTIDYMQRTMEAIKTECPYSCRLDDDVFMSHHVWDYIIDNLQLLDNPNTMLITPLFTTGIPTVDFFINDFLSVEDINTIHQIFKRDNIIQYIWDQDYTSIYNFINNSPTWNMSEYYLAVSNHPSIFKGIHPIRFSYDANLFLTKKILDNFDKFMARGNFYLEPIRDIHNTHPFLFRTESWREALRRGYDHFDEISLNRYSLENNMISYIIRNGFAVHMCHGIVPHQSTIEEMYYSII